MQPPGVPSLPSPPSAAGPVRPPAGIRRPELLAILILLAARGPGIAQQAERREIHLSGGGSVPLRWLDPATTDPREFQPVVLILPGGDPASSVPENLEAFAAAGWTVLVLEDRTASALEATLPRLTRHLRIQLSPAGGRFVLAGPHGRDVSVLALAAANPFEFSDVYCTAVADPDAGWSHPGGLRFTRVHLVVRSSATSGPNLDPLIHRLGAQARAVSQIPAGRNPEDPLPPDSRILVAHHARTVGSPASPEETDANLLLDRLHDAASRAQAERYFGCFGEGAVFLGTDPGERWTTGEFQAWARPYFDRPSAWVFAPVQRSITFAPDRRVAWFDEVAGSASYGECRGTGALLLTPDGWKIVQYNLSVPVRNDLLPALVKRIRSMENQTPATLTVYAVRHAEKADGGNPGLTDRGRERARALAQILRDVPLDGIICTEWRRTRETATPLAEAKALAITSIPAGSPKAIIDHIASAGCSTVFVAGHTNTIPALLKALGVSDPPQMPEETYGQLFIATVAPEGTRLQTLWF